MTSATLTAPDTVDTDDPDSVHFICRCTPDIALCGEDVSDIPMYPADHVPDVVCPMCMHEADNPCRSCGRLPS